VGQEKAGQPSAHLMKWVTGPHSDATIMLKAMRSALGENDMMAYLAMMAVRLEQAHRSTLEAFAIGRTGSIQWELR
jgi:hypothetical protein